MQYVDVLMLAGKYQFRPDPPFIPGGEAAGEVAALGPGVGGFRIGDRVMSRHRLGAFAELGNSKAEDCDFVPAAMSLDEASVFRGAYHTAYHALLQRGRLKAGDRVLIHGAAGGIGLPAIQIAKLYGAQVIATASTDEKRAACLADGADHAISYQGGFRDRVIELTGGRGVDIVYDPVNGPTFEESLRCLAWGGRILILGFLGGAPAPARSNYLLIKGIEAIGVRIGGLSRKPSRNRRRQYQDPGRSGRAGQAQAAHLAPLPARAGGRRGAGPDRPCGDRQGRAVGQLSDAKPATTGPAMRRDRTPDRSVPSRHSGPSSPALPACRALAAASQRPRFPPGCG